MRQITWQEFFLWLCGQRTRVTVVNRSMMPTLRPGDEVLYQCDRGGNLALMVGDVVISRHPLDASELLIKRIFQIDANHQIDLRGDNAMESTDSRQFGRVPRALIVGKVTCVFAAK